MKHNIDSVDVCVIGAGFTGLSAALELRLKGYSVVIVEAEYVGYGASGRNGGQIACGYAPGMIATRNIVGKNDAEKLWDFAEEAKLILESRITDHNIDCDLVSGEMMCAVKPAHFRDFEAEADFCVSNYGYDQFELCDKANLEGRIGSDKYFGGLLDHSGGHINPLKYVRGLADAAIDAGAELYENTKVIHIDQGSRPTVKTTDAEITCSNVVMAANVYMDQLHPKLANRFFPVGTYILATEPLTKALADELIPENFCVNDSKNILDYYRLSADLRLLYGGRDSALKKPVNLAHNMRKIMLDTFPQLHEIRTDYVWGGQAAITINRLPDIGRLEDNIYYAQGFSGQGVALTGMAGKVIAEAIALDNEKLDVFSRIPHRSISGGKRVRNTALRLAMFWYRLRDMI